MGHFKFAGYRFAAVLFFLGATAISFSQTTRSWKKISGLGENFQENYKISQDTLGNIWIAENLQVVKYNSATQESFTTLKGLPSQATTITGLFIDSVGSIWLGTNLGLCRYNFSEDDFEVVNGKVGKVSAITEDKTGNLWIAGNSVIWKLKTSVVNSKFEAERIAAQNHIVNCLETVQDFLLIGTENGIFKAVPGSGTLQKMPLVSYKDFNIKNILFTENNYLIATAENGLFKASSDFTSVEKFPGILADLRVSDMVLSADHQVYIATKGQGIIHLDQDLEPLDNLRKGGNIYDLYKGKNNTLWVAAKSGVEITELNAQNFQFLTHNPAKYSSLGNNDVTAIAKDDDGKIWFGTKKGLSIWNRQNNTWQHIQSLSYRHESTTPDEIKALVPAGSHMWVATYNDGVYKININTFLRAQYAPDINPKISSFKTTSLLIDAHKNIWIGGDGGGLTKITPDDKSEILPLKNVKNLAEMPDGKIIATSEGKVYQINTSTSSIREIPELSATKFNYSKINSVVARNNHLVFATNHGVIMYNPADKSAKALNEKSGLPSNNVKSVFADSQKEWWAITLGGITNIQIHGRDTILKSFGTAEGLKTLDFNPNAFAKMGNGEIAIGTNSGVQLIRPEILRSQISEPPHLVLTKLKSGNKILTDHTLNWVKSIDLEENQNTFDINFLAIAPSAPEEVEYSWKLDGLEESWSAPVRKNRIQYAGLSPGNYTFMIRTRIKNSNWSAVKKLSLVVASPWYTADWIYVAAALAVLVLIFLVVMALRIFRKNKSTPQQTDIPDAFAYEIKAPLAILLASLNKQILQENSSNTEKLKNTLLRFNALFEPILNLNDSEEKRFSGIQLSRIDLQTFISELIGDFQTLLQDKKLEIIANNQWEKEAFNYNLDRLNRILINLISYAIKYCDQEGKIIINLFETNKGDLKIQISDNGKGIPWEQQKIIKQYFKKGKLSADLQKKDIVTLLLVRDMVKRGGGSILFESVLNEGTTFSLILKNRSKEFVLPTSSEKSTEQIPAVAKPVEVKEFADSKVLIVEDNKEIRRVLTQNIARKCQVLEAADVEEALKMAAAVLPDIVITEKDLPDASGFDLCERMKEDVSLNHIGVFMIVPSEEEVNYVDKKEKGILDFIEKPINVNSILLKISNTLNQQKELRSRYVSSSNVDEEVVFRNENDERFVGELKKIVFQHLHETEFGVHELSAAIGMSSNALYMKLKNLIDLAPQDFIVHTKLSYARKLLVKGEVNIKEVAVRSGFINAETFLAEFKKFYGYSPGGILEDTL
ncbi:MAG: two-component regulator propeller domain-containing protein [Gillisia sp.]